jgi:signal-transduction protein with cAMP-binding, CBS, and nucleotidyltransferase domain
MVIIKEIMTSNIFTIGKNNTIYQAAELMANKGVSCLLILNENNADGIITRRDILEKVILKKINPEEATVLEHMTTPVFTMNVDATIIAASGIMNAKKIKQLPIEMDQKIVGIVTQTDVVRHINKILEYDRTENPEYTL